MSILLHSQMSYMSRIREATYTIISRRNNLIIKWIAKLFAWRKILGTHPMKTKLNELNVISPIFFFFLRIWFHTTVMGSYNY